MKRGVLSYGMSDSDGGGTVDGGPVAVVVR